jgi:hypothetical protein
MTLSRDRLAVAPTPFSRRTMIEAVLAGGAVSLALAARRAPAQATPAAPPIRANTFFLAGDNADIHYFTTSDVGLPMFTYIYPDGEARATGDDIQIVPLVTGVWFFGHLVSIYVDAAPDAWARSITLVLPDINLEREGDTAFTTFAVETTHFTTDGGTDLVQGQLQEYAVIPLEGMARFVVF